MGNSDTKIQKQGTSYTDIRPTLRPFDLVLFSGGEFVSRFIKYIEQRELHHYIGPNSPTSLDAGAFSHVGMIVTSDILDHSNIKKDKIYIWESTASGKLGEGVKNIEDESFLGVQIRDFDALLPVYDEPNNTRVAIARVKNNPVDTLGAKKAKEKFTEIYNKYNGVLYDISIIAEVGAIFGGCRKIRDVLEKSFGPDHWLFCSELIAVTYMQMGIFPKTVIPENVVPMDFLGYEQDSSDTGGIPIVVKLPPVYIVSSPESKK